MDKYILAVAIIGIAAFAMAWMPAITKKTKVSYSILYIIAGVLLYLLLPNTLPSPLPKGQETAILRLSELVVIISIMGTGIKIDRPFNLKTWANPLKLISIAMLLCIAAASFLGYSFLGLDLASAILLGACLAPTDPVLASDVQVDPPNKGAETETKFTLTAEAGLNDGMAFPFTWLAITLAMIAAGNTEVSLLKWFWVDFVYKILAAIAIGILLGKACGWLVFRLSDKYKLLKTTDGFLAVSLTLLVYGLTELLHGYGFIAVFICAITFRHYEKKHHYHEHLHAFTDQAERILIAILLILFGGALVHGVLDALTWKMVLFTFVFLFIIRPLAAYASIFTANIHFKKKLAISFFGIRGMGSIFYLAFAMKQTSFVHEDELWAMVAFTILISVFLHGMTATSIMDKLQEKSVAKTKDH
jgi:sodium/hydrogen antiporter